MYDIVQAVFLGIIQGLTEFLPVSSSGHLEIAKGLFGYSADPDDSLMMTVVLHFATALSTVVVFRKEIGEILSGIWNPSEDRQHIWFCVKILLSMIPAAAAGILFKDQIESLFSENMLLVGAMLIVTGILLLLADRAKTTEKPVSLFDAVVVGVAQMIAILPGISRSGATISTCVLLGVDRQKAAKFSFLMVVPLIFGKMAKDILDGLQETGPALSASQVFPLLAGFVAAFVTGLVACVWMIRLVKACQLTSFAIYCFIVGAGCLGVGLFL